MRCSLGSWMRVGLIAATLGASLGCGDPSAPPSALRAVDGRLRDRDGREVLLRGVNARVEGVFDVTFDDGRVALEDIPPFGEDDCRFLGEDLGFDHLRLPINWSALEPADDQFQPAYVDRILALAAACDRHGVKTIVDFHQDGFSKEIGEDGAPLWAITPPPTQLLEGPLTDLDARRMSAQVTMAFTDFFHDTSGGWDRFAQAVAYVAARIDQQPGIVGLELFNEPYIFFDDQRLIDFHRHVAAAARAVAPGLAVVFEPAALRNLTDSDQASPAIEVDNAIYGPHVYVDVFEDGWAAEDVPKLDASVAATRAEATAHGAALYVGEFGHDASARGGRYVAAAMVAFDAQRASWAYWLYEEWSQGGWGLYDASGAARGALRADRADLLARAYPVAVDGDLVEVSYDPAPRRLTVRLDRAGAGVHVLAAPRRTFPGAVAVTCDGAAVVVTQAAGRVEVGCRGRELVMTPAP
ncbi:MAG: cellulase family glycosylhydrolase [Myxococcales bacterium]|nr:cellulase family glycosylhydrolase [Myxococcales bacterium]